MQVQESIETRRAIKQYDATHQMTEAEIEELFQAAILSPTSFNIQNWRFVLVEDASLRQKIQDASWGQEQVSKA